MQKEIKRQGGSLRRWEAHGKTGAGAANEDAGRIQGKHRRLGRKRMHGQPSLEGWGKEWSRTDGKLGMELAPEIPGPGG